MDNAQNYKTLLTDEIADQVASYIVEKFVADGNNNTIDHKFDLRAGLAKKVDVNTWFKFDVVDGTLLKQVKDVLFPKEEEVIGEVVDESKSKEQLEAESKAMFDDVLAWLIKVRDIINTKHIVTIREKIRDVVLKNAPVQLFPLKRVELINLELADPDPDGDYVIVVNKMGPKGGETGSSAALMQEHIQTGKDLDLIIKEKKEAKDPKFEFVTGAYKKKYAYDIELDFYVDYSLGPKPDMNKVN